MRHTLAITFAALTLSITSAQAADPPPIPEAHQKRFDACTAHLDAFAFDKAKTCFRDFHKATPRSPLAAAALHDLALAERFGGDLEAAIKTQKKLARDYRRDPLAPDALWFIATESARLGHMDDAALHFAAYARRVPGRRRTMEAWRRAITIWRASRKWQNAVDALVAYEKELTRTRPKVVWRAKQIRVELLGELKQFDEALALLKEVETDAKKQGSVAGQLAIHDLRIDLWGRQEKAREVRRERQKMMRLWSGLKDEARQALPASSVELVASQNLDAIDPKFEALLALKLPGDIVKKASQARSLVRKKIRMAVKLRALIAGVPVMAGDQTVPSWQRARFMLARIDDEIARDIRKLGLDEKRTAKDVAKLALEPGTTLKDRALATYEEVLASVDARGHHTASIARVLERLDRLVAKSKPMSEIHPGVTYEHETLQRVPFIELGNNPTL